MFRHQRIRAASNPAPAPTPGSPDPTTDVRPQALLTGPPESGTDASATQAASSGRPERTGIVPMRCLSPGSTRSRHEQTWGAAAAANQDVDGNTSVSLCRRLLQEVKLDDFTRDEGEDKRQKSADRGDSDSFRPLGGLRTLGDDDEELRMLASLKREQEEDECRASGLSASQIRQCNVSVSMCSDDASTWTHISAPANQGHHYQKEMNPLLQSNPREWMDVLSPPIMPPSQQRRSGNTWNNQENLIGGGDESMNEEENEDEYLNLLYDPCLNCYFDPKTGKYYELA